MFGRLRLSHVIAMLLFCALSVFPFLSGSGAEVLLPKRPVPQRPQSSARNTTDSQLYVSDSQLIQLVSWNEEIMEEPQEVPLKKKLLLGLNLLEEDKEDFEEDDDTVKTEKISQETSAQEAIQEQKKVESPTTTESARTFAETASTPARSEYAYYFQQSGGNQPVPYVNQAYWTNPANYANPANPVHQMVHNTDSAERTNPSFSQANGQINGTVYGYGHGPYSYPNPPGSNVWSGGTSPYVYGYAGYGQSQFNPYAYTGYAQAQFNPYAYAGYNSYGSPSYGSMPNPYYPGYPYYPGGYSDCYSGYYPGYYNPYLEEEEERTSLGGVFMETLSYFNPLNSPKGPDRGVGQPLRMRSWLDRPFYWGVFGGVMTGSELVSDLVEQKSGGTGGVSFGWYCDDYWGFEARLSFSALPSNDSEIYRDWVKSQGGDLIETSASRTNKITVLDVAVHYYPLGNAKWRPYLKFGIGTVNQQFSLYDQDHSIGSFAMPIGVGLRYWWNDRIALQGEIVDNVLFASEIAKTQNNFGFTLGLTFPIGKTKRKDPVLYWPVQPSARR